MNRLIESVNNVMSTLSRHFMDVFGTFALFLACSLLMPIAQIYLGSTGILVIAVNVFFAFLFAMTVGFLPTWLRRIATCVLASLYVIVGLMELSGAMFIGLPDTLSIVSLILQTNASEASEFITSYFRWKYVIAFAVALICLLVLPIVLNRAKKNAQDMRKLLF